MRTAIYIEDGVVQLVLTPDNEFEKKAVASFSQGSVTAQIFDGAFYDCRGGWTRQKEYYPTSAIYGRSGSEDRSIILRVTAAEQLIPEAEEQS